MINKISGQSSLEYYPKIASTVYLPGTVVYPNGLGHITTSTSFSSVPLGIVSEEVKATDIDFTSERKIAVQQILPGDKFEATVSVDNIETLSVVQPYLTNALIGNIYSLNIFSSAVELTADTGVKLFRVISLSGNKVVGTIVDENASKIVQDIEYNKAVNGERLLSTAEIDPRTINDGILDKQLPTSGYSVGSSYLDSPLIHGRVFYVSNVASNGFVLGNDANDGSSMTLAKLTIQSAYNAASDGDCIVINSSATIYDSTFYNIQKQITILPWSYRGVTVRSTEASWTWYIDTSNVTIGALIIDSAITSGGRAGSAIRSNATTVTNLRLLGTKLIGGNSYALKFPGACYLYGVETDHSAVTTSVSLVDPATSVQAGNVIVEQCTFGGRFQLAAETSGVNLEIRDCYFNHAQSTALNITGATTALVERCSIKGNLSTTSTGINAYGHARIVCRSLIIRDVNIQNAASAAQQAGGYGIGVGAETFALGGAGFDNVEVYRCNIVHSNHGLFFAYGVRRGRGWGNIIRDAIIGIIQKGVDTGDVIQSGNIIIGGPLTGGAIRSKEAINSKHYNNLVIYDAQTVAAASHFILCNTQCKDVTYKNNILFAPGMTVPSAVFVDPDTTGFKVFAGNIYNGTLGNVFNSGSFSNWIANNEPTALNVDPQFNGRYDFRPSASSPLLGTAATLDETDVRDFVGNYIKNTKGAFAA